MNELWPIDLLYLILRWFSWVLYLLFYSAAEMLNKFHELDVDRSGKLDQQEAKEGLELMTTATGRKLDPREIEFFLKTASDEEGFIDIGKFVSLFKRLKVYDSPAPPKNAKCHVLGSDWKIKMILTNWVSNIYT